VKDRATLRQALAHGNVLAFGCVVDLGEHGPNAYSPDRYRTMFGGSKFEVPPWVHPRKAIKAGDYTSTAAGRGQFLSGTWGDLVKDWGFEDFSPSCQDEAMVALYIRRKALDDIIAGRFEDAIRKCNKEWASLPESPYGQPTLTMDRARERFLESGGYLADPLASEHYGDAVTESVINPVPYPEAQESHMAPLIPVALAAIQAFGPQLLALIPQFGSLLGSGSDVQVRNVKLATAAVDAVVKATGSPNLQAAIETMQKDPEAVKAAQIAAAEVLALVEVGGGIVEARKASYDVSQVDWWKNPAVIVAILVLPLVYMVVSAVVFGAGGQTWSDDVKTLTVTAILSGALGSITGFFLGSSLGSQRKTNILAKE